MNNPSLKPKYTREEYRLVMWTRIHHSDVFMRLAGKNWQVRELAEAIRADEGFKLRCRIAGHEPIIEPDDSYWHQSAEVEKIAS